MKIAALMLVAGLAATANAQLSLVANNTRTWIDISATGTALNNTSPGQVGGTAVNLGDDGEANITAASLAGAGFGGNSLLAVTDIRVGNNGGVLWGGAAASTDVGYDNGSLATAANANSGQFGNGNGARQFIAPLWDDVFGSSSNAARVRWAVVNGTLVITWSDQDHFSAQGTGTITFQLQVYTGSNGGALASFVFLDTDFTPAGGATNTAQSNGSSATIGYRANGFVPSDASLTNTVQWAAANTPNQVIGLNNGAGTAAQPNAIDLVPTPGAAALLGLGGLMAGRRRRA